MKPLDQNATPIIFMNTMDVAMKIIDKMVQNQNPNSDAENINENNEFVRLKDLVRTKYGDFGGAVFDLVVLSILLHHVAQNKPFDQASFVAILDDLDDHMDIVYSHVQDMLKQESKH